MSYMDEELERDTRQVNEPGEVIDNSTLAVLNKSEIDQQIATARRWPRSIKNFIAEGTDLVTLDEATAEECIYALPRDGKTIEGPSARFAEVVANAWGNCRAGARTIAEEDDFVVAQGVFYDLEKNVAITYEVKRRIVDKNGRRYKPDMIGVTSNAACSIALRNAVLKGVPKAIWRPVYEAARKLIMGDVKTLANRRADAIAYLQKFGFTEEKVCRLVGVEGVEDIGGDELVTLKGVATALRDGDTTMEQLLAATDTQDEGLADKSKSRLRAVLDKQKPANPPSPDPQATAASGSAGASQADEKTRAEAERANEKLHQRRGHDTGFQPITEQLTRIVERVQPSGKDPASGEREEQELASPTAKEMGFDRR